MKKKFGVAPDHHDVKNVITTFSKTAENSRFRFIGNQTLGKDFSLSEIRERYHAVLLTYGADKDQKFNIPNEDNFPHLISARQFVAWYNGFPGSENLNPNLKCRNVALIGQGNVAIDCARILLSSIDKLKTTDISDHALQALAESEVEKIYMIGRRGPLQAALTIKELREILKLPNTTTSWRKKDFEGVSEIVATLPRPRKRLTELMLTSLEGQLKISSEHSRNNKEFLPIFFRSPKIINNNSIELIVNKLVNESAEPTDELEIIETDLILKSIGYKSTCADPQINFNERSGLVWNKSGRVLKTGTAESEPDYGLYVAGWLATGPTGVIITTMNNAFAVAESICGDFHSKKILGDESKPGFDFCNRRIVDWNAWKKIDEYETEEGKKKGKIREKIIKINEMLKIANV